MNASNFDIEFTQLSVGSIESEASSTSYDELKGFNFESPVAPLIEYGYSRDFHGHSLSGVCA
jgi:hypothetical protein